MPESANGLLATGFGYAPMAPGHQHTRKFPTEGLPFMNGTFGGFAAMGATPLLNRGMGEVGMVPMGLGHDQNVYDRMMNQRFTMMQMQAMTTASQSDRDNYMKTFRGLAAVSGTPYGSEQRRAAQALANATTHMSPLMADMMPDFLDQMGGARGSATVMSRRIIDAGRYRIDPLTGRMGMSGETVGALSNNLYGSMFSNDNIHKMRGVTAGQAGSLFQELQMRGMVGTAASEGRYMGLRADDPRASTLRAVEDMRRTAPDALSSAARTTGVDMTKPGGLNAGDLDKLMTSPDVGDKIRSFDATRIKSSIQNYAKVVSAMRDIFGDMGKPNAPMAELVAGVEALTMGGMGRLDPGRMSMMVRQTYNLAKQTGVTMDNVMQMQAHAAQRAGQMGIEPGFAVQATQGGLAFGGAYRAQGHGAHGAWGAMSSDQVTQLDTNLRVQAASSNLANRMAVATRLSETNGGFDPTSEAGRYTAAVKAGQSDFIGADGRVRSVMIGDRDFTRMMTGAGKNISEGDVQSMLGQRDTNREYVERFGMSNTIRRVQGTEELHPFVGHRMEETLTGRFRDQLMRSGMGQSAAQARAREVSMRIGQSVTRKMFDMGTEEFANTASRTAGIRGFIEEELDGNGMGDVLAGLDPAQRQQFLDQTADQFYGAGNRAIKGSMYRSFGNLQNVHRLTNRSTLDESDRQQMQARFKAQMQDAMSPLGHGSMLQRAVDALQGMQPDDPRGAMGVIASALGGVKTEDINRVLMPHFNRVNDQRQSVENLQNEVMKTTDPVAKAKLMERLEVARRELTAQAGTLAKSGEQFGLFTADSLGAGDLKQALGSTGRLMTMQNDITGIRGNFGGDVWQAQINDLVARGEAPDAASARALVLDRRRKLPYRASKEQIDAVKQKFPGISDDEAAEMANMRLRAERLGVGVGDHKTADDERAQIANSFAAEADKMFDVSDADIADLKKLDGFRDPTAGEIANYRREFEVDGKLDDPTVMRQMHAKLVVRGRQAAFHDRFNKFWGSTQGAAARDSVDFATQDVASVADKLISSPQMVQRLGTRAIELSDTLKGDQQRLRELALYHADGDVAKLTAGDFAGEFTQGGAAKVREEVAEIHQRQRAILSELAEGQGKAGRQFQLGDETDARRRVLDAEVRAGRMPKEAADKLAAGPAGALSPDLAGKVLSVRESMGDQAEAMRLMGKKPGDAMNVVEAAQMALLTRDVGVARKMTPESDGLLVGYESKLSRLDKMASSRGLTTGDIEKKGDSLLLSGDERGRLDVARRDFNTADRSVNILATREKNVQAMIDSLKDDMSEAGGKRRANLETELSGIQSDLKRSTAARGLAETGVDADAKRKGVTSANYIRGKGWIDAEGLRHFRGLTGERDADKKQIDEMAAALGLKPEDLAGATGVSRRLFDAQGNALRKDTGDPKDIVRNIMSEFGVGKLDGPETAEGRAMAQLMEGNAGRGMGMRLLETQRTMKDRAKRGGKSTDEMSAAYFKAVRSGKGEDMTAFRKAYGMHEEDGHGVLTGKSNREFEDFAKAIQFQQQTGVLGFGVEGRNKAKTQGDLARLYAQAMQGGEMRPGDKPGGGQQPSKMEMTGTVTLKGDQLDLAGVSGRSFLPGGW